MVKRQAVNEGRAANLCTQRVGKVFVQRELGVCRVCGQLQLVTQNTLYCRKELIVLQHFVFFMTDDVDASLPLVVEDRALHRCKRLLEIIEVDWDESARVDPIRGVRCPPIKAERFGEKRLPQFLSNEVMFAIIFC